MTPLTNPALGTTVQARDPDETLGVVVGSRRCTLESCGGTCIGVRWPNKKLTWPCVKGMELLATGWRIL